MAIDWTRIAGEFPVVMRAYAQWVCPRDPLGCAWQLAQDPRFAAMFADKSYREQLSAAGYDIEADWRAVWQGEQR
jgi:hypothetical protein